MKTFGSDKPNHTFGGKNYLDIYDSHLRTIDVRDLLEIGVRDGCSLRMWRHAFPKAQVVGIDIDPDCGRPNGCEVIIGSQDDPAILDRLGGFDVVIDDGSHINTLILASFERLWPKVRPNGMYAIEDLDCSYVDLTEVSQEWPGMHHYGGSRYNNRLDLDLFFLRLIAQMDDRQGDVAEIQFTSGLCVLRKAA